MKPEALTLGAIVTFDASLKAKSKIKSDKEAAKWYKFHSKYMSKIKYLALFLYLFFD